MARTRQCECRGTVERYSDALALIPDAGQYAIVYRGVARSIVMRCPDFCGDVITVNLDGRSGPAWRAYQRKDRLTIYPSVWKQSGCRAHFIVWNNVILWCDSADRTHWSDDALKNSVLSRLPLQPAAHVHFEQIALELEAVPWEVLWACQALEGEGLVNSIDKGAKYRRGPSGTGLLERRGRGLMA